MFNNQSNRPMSNQSEIDYNEINSLLKNGAKSITVDTGDTKMTMKKVGVPTGQAQRNQSGQMQVNGLNNILSQGGSPLGQALEGLASKLGLSGGPQQQGKGAGMINELAGFIANNFGRNQMGTQHMGQGEPPIPLPTALQNASAMNGGAPTVPAQMQAPAPIPAGAGMSTGSMGMMSPQGGPSGGAGGGLAGLLGPMMSAAGKGAPAPSPAMGGGMGGVPPVPQGMGAGSMAPALAQLLGIPGRAAGGPVEAGQPYMVGEEGPEVVVPHESGAVLPNPGSPSGEAAGIEGQVSALIDEVIQVVQERGIPLLGPDGNMSPEALSVFIEILQSKTAGGTDALDPMAEQMGGGPTPNPGSDPLIGAIGSGAGGSNNVPILDGLNQGASAPNMPSGTPSGPDDIQALLAALGG